MDHNSGHHTSAQLQAPERQELERSERHDRVGHERPAHERGGNGSGHERMAHDRGQDGNGHDRGRHDVQRHERSGHERPERMSGERPVIGKKTAPPEQTNAENFYYQKQMQGQTPMVIVLRDGEQIHGVIEWYDKNCIKVLRHGGQSNLMIYKPAIKYMYKEGENQQ